MAPAREHGSSADGTTVGARTGPSPDRRRGALAPSRADRESLARALRSSAGEHGAHPWQPDKRARLLAVPIVPRFYLADVSELPRVGLKRLFCHALLHCAESTPSHNVPTLAFESTKARRPQPRATSRKLDFVLCFYAFGWENGWDPEMSSIISVDGRPKPNFGQPRTPGPPWRFSFFAESRPQSMRRTLARLFLAPMAQPPMACPPTRITLLRTGECACPTDVDHSPRPLSSRVPRACVPFSRLILFPHTPQANVFFATQVPPCPRCRPRAQIPRLTHRAYPLRLLLAHSFLACMTSQSSASQGRRVTDIPTAPIQRCPWPRLRTFCRAPRLSARCARKLPAAT